MTHTAIRFNSTVSFFIVPAAAVILGDASLSDTDLSGLWNLDLGMTLTRFFLSLLSSSSESVVDTASSSSSEDSLNPELLTMLAALPGPER